MATYGGEAVTDTNGRPTSTVKDDVETTPEISEESLPLAKEPAETAAPKEPEFLREWRKLFAEQNDLLRGISRRLDSVAKKRGEEQRILELEVQAIVRRLYIDAEKLPFPNRLMSQAFRIQSQNGEDGISLAIFKIAGILHERFVEIGCGPNGGNSGFYAQDLGWRGLMVDASETNVSKVKQRFGSSVIGQAVWVGVDNINDLIERNGLTGEIDLLSIDIDGNDYWVWEALDACNPRVVIVEYNAAFGPDRAVVVPYEQGFDRHETNRTYYGASLKALALLAQRKGYRLVATEPRGINAFFVRNDVAPSIPASSVESLYRQLERDKDGGDVFGLFEQENLPLIDLEATVAE
jgi:hypothetical protein